MKLKISQGIIYILMIFGGMILLKMDLYSKDVTAARICMDGFFDDWAGITEIYNDASGDNISGDIDFGKLWVVNDERFLYLKFEVGVEIIIQNDNDLTLYLDTDNDPATGYKVSGIGAELTWNFGDRNGSMEIGGNSEYIYQNHIYLVTMPTLSSTQFEICIDYEFVPLLFNEESVTIVLKNGDNGDQLPDEENGTVYVFDNSELPPLPVSSLHKQDSSQIRVMTYNVLHDSPFETNIEPIYDHIFNAIQPEIIGFEEIYNHSAQQTAALIESFLPSLEQQQWYSSKVEPDIIAVSRFPIIDSYAIGTNGAFLINLNPAFDTQLIFIVAHPPCCDNDEGRQYEIDQMMAFVRDTKKTGQYFDIEENTPVIIVGDMNLVGWAQQLTTFLSGDIVNENQFGEDFVPDWDNSDYTDLVSQQTILPMSYTWYSENSSYSPGRLDFIIYSDSVLEPGNHFIFFTPEMSMDTLAMYNLQANDSKLASDHLPVVCDFTLINIGEEALEENNSIPQDFVLKQNFPNPFNPKTMIEYKIMKRAFVNISVCNIYGQVTDIIINEWKTPGDYSVNWDAGKRSSGIYFYKMRVNSSSQVKKCILLR